MEKQEAIEELRRLIDEFEQKLKDGSSDPDAYLTLSEIESMWGKLIGDTTVLYSDMLQSMVEKLKEKDLIRKKKLPERTGNKAEE